MHIRYFVGTFVPLFILLLFGGGYSYSQVNNVTSPLKTENVDREDPKLREELAQKQREKFADMMDKAHLGFNPDAPPDQKANSRLAFEISHGSHYDLEAIKRLLAQGAVDAGPVSSSSLIFMAVGKNDLGLVELLIQSGADINGLDERNFSALHRAIGYGHTEIALALIKAGANLEEHSNNLGNTPLVAAASKGNLEVVNALIKAGADVNYVDEDSYGGPDDALYWALRGGYNQVALALIKAGAVKDKLQKHKKYVLNPNAPRKCSNDKKECPNGQRVSRSGPQCEFEICPEVQKASEVQEVVKGTFTEVDTKLSDDAVYVLNNGTTDEKDAVINQIRANPENYNPLALNALSQTLFRKIEDQDAAFWYMAAFLRRRHDSLICKDDTSSKKMHSNPMVQQFRPYAENNKAVIEGLLPKVLEWDRATPYNYDTRWVNIGTRPSDNKLTDKIPENLCVPEGRKEELREQNRTMYAKNMRQFTEKFDYRNPPQNDWPKQEEFDALLKKAEAGDAQAQLQIVGFKYLKLSSAKTQKEKGDFVEKWLKASASQKHPPAIALLGKHYTLGFDYFYRGHGGAAQTEKGLKMLLEAGAMGYGHAYYYIGEYARHIKKPVEAYAWFSVAASFLENGEQSQPSYYMTQLAAELKGEDWEEAQRKSKEFINTYSSKK